MWNERNNGMSMNFPGTTPGFSGNDLNNSGPASTPLDFFPSTYGEEQPSSPYHNSTPTVQANTNRSDYAFTGFSTLSSPSFTSQASFSLGSARKVNIWTGRYEDEEPLLEVLGINFQQIFRRTSLVLMPTSRVDPAILDDTDLAGPLVFLILMGSFLLLTGKVHFGYIYGMAVISIASIYCLLNLMSKMGIDIYRTISIMGYCVLPMVILAGISIIFPLNGMFGLFISFVSVLWCAKQASMMFAAMLDMSDSKILVMYPVGLVYAGFALLTIF